LQNSHRVLIDDFNIGLHDDVRPSPAQAHRICGCCGAGRGAAGPAPLAESDENLIPRGIEGDIRQQLGPLVKVERGEIRIAHSYLSEVPQEWIEPKN
jgi:hypothetical protein